MKLRTHIWSLFVVILLGYFGCEDNFSPKSEFENKNIIYCIINVDQRLLPLAPIVILSKNYNYEGTQPPTENHYTPGIINAIVSLKYGNKIDTFKQFIDLAPDSNNQFFPNVYYKCRKSPGLDITQKMELELTAVLPDSNMIAGKTRILEILAFDFSYYFVHGITTLIDQWRWGKTWKIMWGANDGNLYFPRFILFYHKSKEGRDYDYSVEIPMRYVKSGNNNIPLFPTYTRDGFIEYSYASIDSVVKNISLGDSVKSDYTIDGFSIYVVEYDKHLSNFYSSTNGYMDFYSIRLDETTYTNISGGIGIFGTSMFNSISFEIDRNYAASFGYKKGG
ncbi:MAG: hypothetical protein C4539_17025 [Ignavibacteriales bacterium]|nr:MAG: hypothetical protein C4539_17025 [Ignavibacteriales bacterium]